MADFVRSRINILYDNLREIRLNIVEVSRINEYTNGRRNSSFQLSYDQRFLVDLYSTMYNTTLRQLDYLERYSENFDNLNRIYINGQSYIIEQIDAEIPANNINPTTNTSTRTSTNVNDSEEDQPRQRQRQRNRSPENTNLLNLNDLLNEAFRSFNNPVVVRATEEQIENATRSVLFCDVENPTNTNCPICLDVFDSTTPVMQIRGCGHLFIPTEIHRWFQSSVKCPVCRYDIRNSHSSSTPLSSAASAEPELPRETINNRSRRYRHSMERNPSLVNTENTTSIFSNTSQRSHNNLFNYERAGDQILTSVLSGLLDPSGNQNFAFDSVFRI